MRGHDQPGQEEEEEEAAAAGSHLTPGGREQGQHGLAQWGTRGIPGHPGREMAAAQPARSPTAGDDPEERPKAPLLPPNPPQVLPRSPLPEPPWTSSPRVAQPPPWGAAHKPPAWSLRGPQGRTSPGNARPRGLLLAPAAPHPALNTPSSQNCTARCEPSMCCCSREPQHPTEKGALSCGATPQPSQPRGAALAALPPWRCAACPHARLRREPEPVHPAQQAELPARLWGQSRAPPTAFPPSSLHGRGQGTLLSRARSCHPSPRLCTRTQGFAYTMPAQFGYLQRGSSSAPLVWGS